MLRPYCPSSARARARGEIVGLVAALVLRRDSLQAEAQLVDAVVLLALYLAYLASCSATLRMAPTTCGRSPSHAGRTQPAGAPVAIAACSVAAARCSISRAPVSRVDARLGGARGREPVRAGAWWLRFFPSFRRRFAFYWHALTHARCAHEHGVEQHQPVTCSPP